MANDPVITKNPELVINVLSEEQYQQIPIPSDQEIYLTPDDTDEKLAGKQDKLVEGPGIHIDQNTNIISATTAESNFRGRFANYTVVPTTAGGYAPDYRGIRTPSNNDYMVVSDASDYAQTTSFVSDGTYINYNIDGYKGTLKISEIPSTRIHLGEFNQFDIRCDQGTRLYTYCNLANTYKASPSATTYVTTDSACINVDPSSSWSYSFYRDGGSYQGAWRFRYIGMWNTDGKSGWLPEYQVEDVLPIATDQEAGIAKLYTTTGQNTDGSMTQKSITNELGKRVLQVTEFPEATSENVGTIVQFIGTDPSYTTGYFYEVTPYSHSSSLESQVLGSVTVNSLNINTFESTVFPSGNYEDTTLVFIYNGSDWTLDGNVVTISDYGVSLYGTPILSDKITLTYVAPSSGYEWIRTDVQPNPTTYESFFRGRYETWVSVPTNVNNYIPDFHGNTTPLKNDYMVVTDASGYVNPDFTNDPENTTFIKTNASVYSLDIVVGSNRISTYYTDFSNVYKTIREVFEAKGIPGVGCTWLSIKYIPGSPGWWALKATNDYFLDNVQKTSSTEILFMNTSESAGTTHYTSKDAGVAPIPLSGGWRFRYTGEWNTDGKNGWKPEYQVEDVLPIASSTIQGIAKLYTTTGQHTDGSMTQKSITDALDTKVDDVKIYGTSKVDRPTKTANLKVVEQEDTLPTASIDYLGRIYQYTGTTNLVTGLDHGFFYECVLVSEDAQGTQTVGTSLTDITIVASDFGNAVSNVDGTYTFVYDGSDWSLSGSTVTLGNYGITLTGTPVADDEFEVVYVSEHYEWTAIPVQPEAEPITSAQIQALWSE